ncbi:MAG: hypothetical protein AB1847_00655 [bacterium]
MKKDSMMKNSPAPLRRGGGNTRSGRSMAREKPSGTLMRILLGTAVLFMALYASFMRGSKMSRLTWAQENAASPEPQSASRSADSTTAAKSGGGQQKSGVTWDSLREVQESLNKREARIRESEQMLEQKEQRIAGIEQEIVKKIEELKLLKQEIEQMGKQLDEQKEQRIKELSKIFEGAPPEKAGSIFAQTDASTAAAIIMRMDKRKAGRLWGFVDPKLAAEITKNIIAEDARAKKLSDRRSSGQ